MGISVQISLLHREPVLDSLMDERNREHRPALLSVRLSVNEREGIRYLGSPLPYAGCARYLHVDRRRVSWAIPSINSYGHDIV